jgi:hypothetical protein
VICFFPGVRYKGFPCAPTRERPLRGPANAVRSISHMFSRLGLLLAAGLLASACATARAAAPVERPPLEVPPVPPRIVEAAPAPDLGNLEPVADLPPEKPIPAASAKPRPSNPRDTSNREGQKAEVKPPDPLPPVAEPPPNPAPQAAAPPTIRTPATADTAASERQIRDTMQSAQKGLNNVNFHQLNGQRKRAYNEAKDFIERAEAAIKSSNFELAKELAGKAEKLANELQGR